MNINNVYLARIYIKYDENVRYKKNSNIPITYSKGSFVKVAKVEKKIDIDGRIKYFKDLDTREVYKHTCVNDCKRGELYVNVDKGLIPVVSLINKEIDNPNMSKRRIKELINNS